MRHFLLLAVLFVMLVPSLTFAQEAKKFSSYQATMNEKVAPLPVYLPTVKGKKRSPVVDNEVITTFDKAKNQYQAVYVVRAKLKDVTDFYKTKLGFDPKKVGTEALGDVLYIFKVPLKEADQFVLEVQVKPLFGSKNIQISLMRREATPLDPRVEEF